MSYREYKFSELCTITRGSSPRPIHDYLTKEGMPWIKISDATAEQSPYIRGTKECIKQEGVKASVKVYKGDLILSNSATPGLPKFLGIDACIHDGWMLLRDFKNITKEYAYWLLLSERTKLVAQGNGSVFTNLKTDILKNHVVKVPDNQTQLRVVNIIGTIQKKISLIEDTNQTLEAIAQAIFKSWFVNFDPVHAKQQGMACACMDDETAELFPDSFEDSELGQIPKGWRAGTLSDLLYQEKATVVPSAKPAQHFEHYSLPAYDENQMPTKDLGSTIKSNKIFVSKQSVLVSKLNPRIPRVWWPADPKQNSICSTEFLPFAPRAATGATKEFVFNIFKNKSIQDRICQQVSGTSGSHQRVRPSDITSMTFVVPSTEVLGHFATLTSPLMSAAANNRLIEASLCEIRDTLLPRLISGKLDVSAIEAQLEEMA